MNTDISRNATPPVSQDVGRVEPRLAMEGAVPGAEPETIDLLDLALALAERKGRILAAAALGGLIMAAVAFLLRPTFTATAVVMPPQQSQSTASALIGQLGSIAGVAGANLGLKTPGDLYVGVLGGTTIADDLIKAFDLRAVYEVRTLTEARKELAAHTTITAGKDSLIKVSVSDWDPKRAAAIANEYVNELHKQTVRLAFTESSQRRVFFEQQLDAQKKTLAQTESSFRAAQERTGVVQAGSQVESIIRAMAQLRAEIVSREVALTAIRSGATAQNPEVVRQETELSALREQLRKMETGKAAGTGDPFLPAATLPKVGMEYLAALRDLKYSETLFELIAKQYEIARIDEAKEAPVIQIVDRASPPDRKSGPPRLILALAGAIAGGVVACLLVLIGRRLSDPENTQKLRALKHAAIPRVKRRSSAG